MENQAIGAEFVDTYSQMDDTESRIIYPNILRRLGEPTGKNIIDYGCGEGELASILANQGAHVLGLDISEAIINNARAKRTHPNLVFEQVYDNTLPAADESIDSIVSNLVFMMVPSIDGLRKIMHESYRALRQRGRLVFTITTPAFIDKDFPTFRTIFADGFRYKESGQPYQFVLKAKDGREITNPTFRDYHYTWEDYINLVCDSGLRLERVKELTIPEHDYPLYVVFSTTKS